MCIWIKADSCDLSAGFMESVEEKWQGDVNFNDGQVNQLYKSYLERQQICSRFGLKEPRYIFTVNIQAENIRNVIKPDMAFISKGIFVNNDAYNFINDIVTTSFFRVTTSTSCMAEQSKGLHTTREP